MAYQEPKPLQIIRGCTLWTRGTSDDENFQVKISPSWLFLYLPPVIKHITYLPAKFPVKTALCVCSVF